MPHMSKFCMPTPGCQHSVMSETTVKQHAFAFIVFDFQNWDTRLHRLYFSEVNIRQTWHTMCRDSAGLWSPGGEVALLRLRLFPRALLSDAKECSRGVGEETSACRFLYQLCDCSDRFAHVRHATFVCEIYLRLKPLVVKTSSDIVAV